MQSNTKSIYLRLELLWWAITIILVLLILFPIYLFVPQYPFYFSNTLFILAFITLTRYIFLLKYTFLANRQILKIALVCVSIPFIFILAQELHRFQIFIDEQGIEAIAGPVAADGSSKIGVYIQSEMFLFAVGSLVAAVIFPIRMIMAIWRKHNKGRV